MRFLTVEDVLRIHASQLQRFGGGAGIRTLEMLESAVARPQASFGGEYLHLGVFEMADRPESSVRGREQARGPAQRPVLLDTNGETIGSPDERLYGLTVAVASGEAGKEEIASLFRVLASGAA